MIWPEVADERAMALRKRGIEAPMRLPWRSNGPVLALVFFVLTCLGIMAAFGFFTLLRLPAGWLTAILCIGLAEFLIQRRHFFGTGVESALWLGGLFAVIFGLAGSPRIEVLLLFAAASAVAGLRMRNGLFGTLAAVFCIAYLEESFSAWGALIAGLTLATVALAALRRAWQRPSTENLWMALLVFAPIAVAIWSWDAIPPRVHSLLFLTYAAVALVSGLLMRHHAPLIACGVNLGIALSILIVHYLLPYDLEWQLIGIGACLLIISWLTWRALRDRTSGLVVTPASLTPHDEELQIAATVAVPQPKGEPAPESRGAGGQFGGAGSTGEY